MPQNDIVIKNARTHNLKGVSLTIPKDKIVVFTGVSGSGKSSLLFDTIYTEAQRQLIETFSTFARARMPKLSKPDVEEIKNISTAIVIDQKRMGSNLRSTVGTATELYTYLRLLFSRCGDEFIGPSFAFGFNHPLGMCPDCKGLGKQIKVDIDLLINKEKSIAEGAIDHPDYKVGGWQWRELGAIGLFDTNKKVKDFSKTELDDLLYAEGIPVDKIHGAGTYTKKFEGVARKLERIYLKKAPEELNEGRKNAYQKYFTYAECVRAKGRAQQKRAPRESRRENHSGARQNGIHRSLSYLGGLIPRLQPHGKENETNPFAFDQYRRWLFIAGPTGINAFRRRKPAGENGAPA